MTTRTRFAGSQWGRKPARAARPGTHAGSHRGRSPSACHGQRPEASPRPHRDDRGRPGERPLGGRASRQTETPREAPLAPGRIPRLPRTVPRPPRPRGVHLVAPSPLVRADGPSADQHRSAARHGSHSVAEPQESTSYYSWLALRGRRRRLTTGLGRDVLGGPDPGSPAPAGPAPGGLTAGPPSGAVP
jgi:hypothetical protein